MENYTEFSSADLRVGILDIPWINNFGACLISYALQQVTSELGYYPEIIDYSPIRTENFNIKNKVEPHVISAKNSIKQILGKKILREVPSSKFDLFRTEILNYSRKYDSKFKSGFPIYPRYIVGSDVVWKPKRLQSEEKNVYFLKFAPTNSVKIAYAASIGTDDKTELHSIEYILKENISQYDYVSVREKTSASYLSNLLNKDITSVIDPTLLIDLDKYEKLIESAHDTVEEDYLFFYSLGMIDERIFDFVFKIATKKNLKIVYYGLSTVPEFWKANIKDCINDGPIDFLDRIKNATLIITDSFHGTVFSVLFHKNFYTLGREKINLRMTDFLDLLEIRDRFIADVKVDILSEEVINYDKVDQILFKERSKGRIFLKHALEKKIHTKNRIETSNKEMCCACGVCVAVCPTKSIKMIYEKGAQYPQVSESRCIECGKCSSVCPVLNSKLIDEDDAYFAIKNNDNNIAWKSTSAGLFYLLAHNTLKKNGVVYAAGYNNEMRVTHKRTTCLDDIYTMVGSKYVQCEDGEEIFNAIKNDLENSMQVMYVGTPCQCYSLKKILKNINCKKLLLVDFVCHGVPGQGLWQKYLNDCHKKKIQNAVFRKKTKKWCRGVGIFQVHYDDGSVYEKKSVYDPYYYSFLSSVALRDSCFSCHFKKGDSGSDLTMGDCWGIEKIKPDFYSPYGVSLAIPHSEKGTQVLEDISCEIKIARIDKMVETENNPRICSSAEYNFKRRKFLAYIEKNPYRIACYKTFGLKYTLSRLIR